MKVKSLSYVLYKYNSKSYWKGREHQLSISFDLRTHKLILSGKEEKKKVFLMANSCSETFTHHKLNEQNLLKISIWTLTHTR